MIILDHFFTFVITNLYHIPDIFFGLLASLGALSFIAIIIAFFTGNGRKGTKRFAPFSFWLGLMMLTPAVMYYLMITKFGYDRWVSAFAGMFFMFIMNHFVRRVALSDESE